MKPVCLIIGAGPKLGLSIARLFSRQGYQLSLIARSAEHLENISQQLIVEGATCRNYQADVSQPALFQQVIRQIYEDYSQISVVIYNAAQFSSTPLLTIQPEEFNQLIHTNLTGALLAAQQVAGPMQLSGFGTFVLVSTGAALRPFRISPGYSVTKAGMRLLGLNLAEELRPLGIHVLVVTVEGWIKENGSFTDAIAQAIWHECTQPPQEWQNEIVCRDAGQFSK